mgnify:CR=1 FL=1
MTQMIYNSNPQVEETVLTQEEEVLENKIVLFDDDVNTFDFVRGTEFNMKGYGVKDFMDKTA